MNEKIKLCKKCGVELIPTKEFGYFHPSVTNCEEFDGVMIHYTEREEFNKKYGTPKHSYKELLKKIVLLERENKKWKQKVKETEEKAKSLQKNKLSKWRKKIMSMFS